MYQAGTILKRKAPFDKPKPGGINLQPYNEIEVIGPSPVQTNVRSAEWGDQGGDNISVKPTSFGDVVDRPERELERDYVVSYEPPMAVELTHTVTRVIPGDSPEDQFRKADDESGIKKSETRVPTPLKADKVV